jgi:hypothetical protein
MAYESESLLVNGDPNDSKLSANLINVGDWLYGNLGSVDDVDYFKFTLDNPGLLKLNFTGADPTRSTTSWKVDLLDANLDFARTLATSAAGTLTAAAGDSNKVITVSGLTVAAKVGDKFTVVTTAADSQIYTVVEASSLKSGAQTLTLDTTWAPTADTTILFDPARLLAAGGASRLSVNVPQAGTYYLKVSSAAFTDASYGLRLDFESAAETDLNNTKEQAVTENSRLVPDLKHSGVATNTDTDVWLISTAQAGAFNLNFAPGTSDAGTKFNVKVETWTKVSVSNVLTDVLTGVTSNGQLLSGTVTGATTFQVDANANNQASTYVVTVTTTSLAAGGIGAYSLKATGEALDVNDAPLIQVGSYTSGRPDELLDLRSLVNLSVGADKQIALSSFFSASDADSGQTLTYKFTASAATGSSATGSIKIKQTDGSLTAYTNGASMTADQFTKAYLVAGSSLGDLQLDAQAFDSSGLPDNSGTSSLVRLKVRVVSSAAGVTVGTDGQLQLVEGVSSGSAGYEESLTFKLKEAPATGETVTLRLVDTDKQFLLSKTALTFTADNYGTDQTVKVRALNDGTVEGASQKPRLNFSLASNSGSSAYTGLSVDQLTFLIADPSNTAATGALTLTSKVTQGDTLTIDTSAIADVDGVGTLNYQWQRSKDGSTWTSIANAFDKSYTLVPADAASKVRVVVSFIDGKGNVESLTSTVTDNVVGSNVSPTSNDTSVSPAAKAGLLYKFKPADFPFADLNEGDSLSNVTLLNVPSDSLLRYSGEKISTGSDGFEIAQANLSKLTFRVPAGKSVGDVIETVSFKVSDASGGSSGSHLLNLILGALSVVPNSVATAALSLPSKVTQGDTLTIDTSSIADLDGLGAFSYQWARSKDGISWVNIANATAGAYVLVPADATSKVRVVVSFIDDQGNAESLTSSGTGNVIARNVPPTSLDAKVTAAAKAGLTYHFKPVDFPFSDLNEGDSLSSVTLLNVSIDSSLRYNGEKINSGSAGFEIARANLSKLTMTVPVGKSVGDTLETVSFKVSDSSGARSDMHSISLSLAVWSGVYAYSNDSGVEIREFQSYAKTTGLNSRMQSAVGVDVSLLLASGSAKGSFDVNVDSSLNVNGYWVKDSAGYWVNLANEVNTAGGITTLSVQLEDGKYDSDTALGVVADSAVIAQMPLSVVGITPDATQDGLWF